MSKKRTDMVSAMDAHEVGCPDLAFEVDSTEWILNLVAMSFNISSFSWDSAILISAYLKAHSKVIKLKK